MEDKYFRSFLNGTGRIVYLDPGNQGNPPGDVPYTGGTYQFIPEYAFQGAGHVQTDVLAVPPSFRDWGQMGVNIFDASGETGGGVSLNQQAALFRESLLFYDVKTGLYYNLGSSLAGSGDDETL
jgi:hypothetical protein